jgi:hypothetical protein
MTIDDDVAATLERLRRQREASLKDIVNEALRRGLRDMTTPAKQTTPFRIRPFDVGAMLIPDIDNVAEVIAAVDGDAFK